MASQMTSPVSRLRRWEAMMLIAVLVFPTPAGKRRQRGRGGGGGGHRPSFPLELSSLRSWPSWM